MLLEFRVEIISSIYKDFSAQRVPFIEIFFREVWKWRAPSTTKLAKIIMLLVLWEWKRSLNSQLLDLDVEKSFT